MDVTRTERLLNLVIALLAARSPVSRSAIQSSVAGYDPEATTSAFERMFERDKDELRGMGIPIETIFDAHGEVQGYLIDADEYGLAPIDLSLEELSVVSVAARVWDEAVLAPAALTGVRKLEAQLGGATGPVTVQMFSSLAAKEAAFLPLLRAVRERKVVTFAYRKPADDAAAKRTIEPWGIRSIDGHWYVVGWDLERAEQRSFRLSRIEGKVNVTARACESTANRNLSDVGLEPPDDVIATIEIPAGTGAEIRRLPGSQHVGGHTWQVRSPRRELLAMLLRADPGVEVTAPDDLIEELRDRLTSIVQVHR